MKYIIKAEVHVFLLDDQLVVNPKLDQQVNKDWLLGLIALREGVLKSISVAGEESFFSICFDSQIRQSTVSRPQNSKHYLVTLGRREIEYLIGFSIHFGISGIADVNHIDIELKPISCEFGDAALTVEVSMYQTLKPSSQWNPKS